MLIGSEARQPDCEREHPELRNDLLAVRSWDLGCALLAVDLSSPPSSSVPRNLTASTHASWTRVVWDSGDSSRENSVAAGCWYEDY
ncbi:hypothetical protein ACP70R_031374 [Stipagrostis hirtigluma subsp. patula]